MKQLSRVNLPKCILANLTLHFGVDFLLADYCSRWGSRHVAGLPGLEGVCRCSGKLSGCYSKRSCVCCTGVYSYIPFWVPKFLSSLLNLQYHKWISDHIGWHLLRDYLKISCFYYSDVSCWCLDLQAEAAFDAKDYERAASFYAKVHNSFIL